MTLSFRFVCERFEGIPPLTKCMYFCYCCCLWTWPLSRIRTQALKYFIKDVPSNEKIRFGLQSPSLKWVFFLYVKHHCSRPQVTRLISESHERSTEGTEV